MVSTSERLIKLETKQKILIALVSTNLGLNVVPKVSAKILSLLTILF